MMVPKNTGLAGVGQDIGAAPNSTMVAGIGPRSIEGVCAEEQQWMPLALASSSAYPCPSSPAERIPSAALQNAAASSGAVSLQEPDHNAFYRLFF